VSGPLTGYLKLAADGTATVSTSSLIFTGGGGSFSAGSIVALAADGKIRVLAQKPVNVLISVQGYYTGGGGTVAPGGYVPVPPRRLVDTRIGSGLPQAKLGLNSTTAIQIGGLGGVPADASAAFVMLSAISTSTVGGSFTPYATGRTRPASVAFSYLASTTTVLGMPVDLGADGRLNLAVGGTGTTISGNPSGYSFYNNTMYYHNVVTQFSWNVPGYPGYWYFYARSLCSHTKTRGNAAMYRFAPLSTGLPGDKSAAGYRN
jgi:hypothetical protein